MADYWNYCYFREGRNQKYKRKLLTCLINKVKIMLTKIYKLLCPQNRHLCFRFDKSSSVMLTSPWSRRDFFVVFGICKKSRISWNAGGSFSYCSNFHYRIWSIHTTVWIIILTNTVTHYDLVIISRILKAGAVRIIIYLIMTTWCCTGILWKVKR